MFSDSVAVRAVKTTPELKRLCRISSTQIKRSSGAAQWGSRLVCVSPFVCIKQLSSRLILAAPRRRTEKAPRELQTLKPRLARADRGYNWLSGPSDGTWADCSHNRTVNNSFEKDTYTYGGKQCLPRVCRCVTYTHRQHKVRGMRVSLQVVWSTLIGHVWKKPRKEREENNKSKDTVCNKYTLPSISM